MKAETQIGTPMTRPFLKRSVTALPLLLWCLAMMTVLLLPFCAALLPQGRINRGPTEAVHTAAPRRGAPRCQTLQEERKWRKIVPCPLRYRRIRFSGYSRADSG